MASRRPRSPGTSHRPKGFPRRARRRPRSRGPALRARPAGRLSSDRRRGEAHRRPRRRTMSGASKLDEHRPRWGRRLLGLFRPALQPSSPLANPGSHEVAHASCGAWTSQWNSVGTPARGRHSGSLKARMTPDGRQAARTLRTTSTGPRFRSARSTTSILAVGGETCASSPVESVACTSSKSGVRRGVEPRPRVPHRAGVRRRSPREESQGGKRQPGGDHRWLQQKGVPRHSRAATHTRWCTSPTRTRRGPRSPNSNDVIDAVGHPMCVRNRPSGIPRSAHTMIRTVALWLTTRTRHFLVLVAHLKKDGKRARCNREGALATGRRHERRIGPPGVEGLLVGPRDVGLLAALPRAVRDFAQAFGDDAASTRRTRGRSVRPSSGARSLGLQ